VASHKGLHLFAIGLISNTLVGCGILVPDIKEAWDRDYAGDPASNTPPISGAGQIQYEVKKRIYCGLAAAVQVAKRYNTENSTQNNGTVKTSTTYGLIPDDWGAQVSVTLQVDESSALNPGVAFNTPILPSLYKFPNGVALPASQSAQSSSLGFRGHTFIDRYKEQQIRRLLVNQEVG
jgi:hypothetical protein